MSSQFNRSKRIQRYGKMMNKKKVYRLLLLKKRRNQMRKQTKRNHSAYVEIDFHHKIKTIIRFSCNRIKLKKRMKDLNWIYKIRMHHRNKSNKRRNKLHHWALGWWSLGEKWTKMAMRTMHQKMGHPNSYSHKNKKPNRSHQYIWLQMKNPTSNKTSHLFPNALTSETNCRKKKKTPIFHR